MVRLFVVFCFLFLNPWRNNHLLTRFQRDGSVLSVRDLFGTFPTDVYLPAMVCDIVPYRFSAFWLRSKCSICSYQLNIWYVVHRTTRILNWFLEIGGVLGACSTTAAGWPGIAVPPGSAHHNSDYNNQPTCVPFTERESNPCAPDVYRNIGGSHENVVMFRLTL